MEDKAVIIIGAVNVDICGRPDGVPRLYDSNPGHLSFSPGGVGRNIAHNLSLMGQKVRLLAAVADDFYGELLLKSCTELGIDMSLSRRLSGGRSSSYLYLTDEKGDMLIGLCDAEITEMINPEYLATLLPELNSAAAVVIDGNLPPETVAWVAENVSAPLYADPVSCAKAVRLRPAFSKLCALKPNIHEAVTLTGEAEPEAAAERLLHDGIKRVFISMDKDGLLAAEQGKMLRLPIKGGVLSNATGCGDSMTAAIILAGVRGLDLEKTAELALTAAAITAADPLSVSPDIRKISEI